MKASKSVRAMLLAGAMGLLMVAVHGPTAAAPALPADIATRPPEIACPCPRVTA